MRVILIPEAVDALHAAEAATGFTGTDVVNRALQIYALIAAAADGAIIPLGGEVGPYLRVYR